MQSVKAKLLTKEQSDLGFEVCEDEDLVELWFKDKCVSTYSAFGVTISQLRLDADVYISGIKMVEV